MKKFLLSALLILGMVGCGLKRPPVTQPPLPTEAVIAESIVRLTTTMEGYDGQYVCTAFSIGQFKFMTAAHCVGMLGIYDGVHLYVNDQPAFLLAEDKVRDLAIIMADINKPALKFRVAQLAWLEEVKAIGYGHGLYIPLVTEHRVMTRNYLIEAELAPMTIFMTPFIGGMSGGPIFDKQGLVVGVVQRGTNFVALGVDVATIMDFMNENNFQ